MKTYSYYGFNEFILALGYKADYIKEFFLNQKAFTSDFILDTKNHKTTYYLKNRSVVDNFKITFIDTGLSTLPGERILLCKKYIPDRDKYFMVTYGDAVTDINFKKLLLFHKKQKTIGTITGVHPRSKYGLVIEGKKNLVRSFKEKPVLPDWVNGGFMVFKKKFFDYLRPGEMEHEGLERLSKVHQLSMYKHDGFWYAVDTYKELEELNNLWNNGSFPWKVWK